MPPELPSQQAVLLKVDQALHQAIAHHKAGRLQEAERLYRSILQTEPNHPVASHNLEVLAVQGQRPVVTLPHFNTAADRLEQGSDTDPSALEISCLSQVFTEGHYSEVARLARQMTECYPLHGLGWKVLGVALSELGQSADALVFMQKAVDLIPRDAEAHNNLGNAQCALNQLADAVASYRQALNINPGYAEAFNNLGNAQRVLGTLDEAVACYQTAIEIKPEYARAYSNLGNVLRELGRLNEALVCCQRALKNKPDFAEAFNNLANVHKDLGQFDAAVVGYQKAVNVSPDYAEAHNNLGVVLKDVSRLASSISCGLRAVKIKPDFADGYYNLGIALKELGKLDAAASTYRKAINVSPGYAEAHNNLGIALKELGNLDDAVASYRKATGINPNYAEAHNNLGQILLLKGNFQEGLRRNESRFDTKLKKRQSFQPSVTFPQWQGEHLTGQSLLIWPEQGLGDQIQFCRFLPILRAQGARRITLVCSAPLKSLLQRFDGANEVLSLSEVGNVAIHDYWTFPLSLPLHCNTTPDNIPSAIPYLYADKARQSDFSIQLANVPAFKVGICWQGAKGYASDAERSPGLEPFKRLFKVIGATFVTLQPESRDLFLTAAGSAAYDLGHEIDSLTPPFEETAALIMNLDLVITCDTSVGHLAGALGKPVWVVLPFVPDWRWMMDREDSPWYPNTRLFRQTVRGDWADAFERVARRLESVVAGESPLVWPIAATQ